MVLNNFQSVLYSLISHLVIPYSKFQYPSDYKIMYDQKGIDIIEKRCGNILEKFGYNF